MMLFLIFFWLTLYSSIAWMLVAVFELFSVAAWPKADTVMLGVGRVAQTAQANYKETDLSPGRP